MKPIKQLVEIATGEEAPGEFIPQERIILQVEERCLGGIRGAVKRLVQFPLEASVKVTMRSRQK